MSPCLAALSGRSPAAPEPGPLTVPQAQAGGEGPSFEEFLATHAADVPVVNFLLNLLLAAVLAVLLGKAYVRFGTTLSNRAQFARNFLLVTMTVMLIITIVK